MEVIAYDAYKHFETVKSIGESRGVEIYPFFLSQTGFLVVDEDVENPDILMGIWVYSILDVPIIQLDHLISKKGMNIQQARRCWEVLFNTLKNFVRILEEKTNGKYIIRATICKKLSKEIKKYGFVNDPNEFVVSRLVLE